MSPFKFSPPVVMLERAVCGIMIAMEKKNTDEKKLDEIEAKKVEEQKTPKWIPEELCTSGICAPLPGTSWWLPRLLKILLGRK